MADREEDELRMALEMSMQQPVLEPIRTKPLDAAGFVVGSPEESSELKNRRMRRELMAAAAEKRMMEVKKLHAVPEPSSDCRSGKCNQVTQGLNCATAGMDRRSIHTEEQPVNPGNGISDVEANKLFSSIFGSQVSRNVLSQWTHQGIRFSPDPETSMGLVQHESGPCGVLAAIQAYVLKHILFSPDNLGKIAGSTRGKLNSDCAPKGQPAISDHFAFVTESIKSRALIRSMTEILFLCGSNRRAVIAMLDVPGLPEGSACSFKQEISCPALDGLSIESSSDLNKILRVNEFATWENACQKLESVLPIYESRMGALLFLVSALLSRGLDSLEEDRDDPSQPLVTAPFGHASQEIVNLLLCGQAVPNVFDGCMDLGEGMSLKGISGSVEVGFLTLLESLNLCKVGQFLKCPQWPIWVVGSESHYSVLFALDTSVQAENELEERESHIRKAFDTQDQSGGGGFISAEGLNYVLREANIKLPADKLDHLCSTGFIVWSEFWQVILEVDTSSGGLKDSSGLMGKTVFDLYHFNGIAKSVSNGGSSSSLVQRPRLTKLRVTVPPRWTPEEFMGSDSNGRSVEADVVKSEPSKHAPLVDCVRTRWPRAVCNWEGDPPSIV